MTKVAAPDNDQTADQVEAYYRKVKPGDMAVIRCTQGNVLRYLLDTEALGGLQVTFCGGVE
jgi:hypothetical protein